MPAPPRTIALPLRVTQDGHLAREDGADALVRLIGAMAATTAGTWPHARWFGLHERVLGVNPDVEDQAGLTDAFNESLERLGVSWARVSQVRSVRGGAAWGERRFSITLLVGEDGRPVTAGVSA